jgi:hypothetical protein
MEATPKRSLIHRMRISSFILASILCLLLQGCASNSLRVVQSNSRTVTLEYNSVLTNYGAVVQRAEAEGRKYGKQAVVRTVIDARRQTKWGAINTIVFDLVN